MNYFAMELMKIKAIVLDTPNLTVLGVIGGSICGILILSLNSLIGRSGTTDSNYIGAWDWGIVGLGIMYGGFFGIYIIFLRKIGVRKAILPAFLGTILGGFFGGFFGPSDAMVCGISGFLISLLVVWLRAQSQYE
jgi:hypothetical protein